MSRRELTEVEARTKAWETFRPTHAPGDAHLPSEYWTNGWDSCSEFFAERVVPVSSKPGERVFTASDLALIRNMADLGGAPAAAQMVEELDRHRPGKLSQTFLHARPVVGAAHGPARFDAAPLEWPERWGGLVVGATDAVRDLVNKQAEDEGLWFMAASASEAYLQQELRRLHALIEAGPVVEASGERTMEAASRVVTPASSEERP